MLSVALSCPVHAQTILRSIDIADNDALTKREILNTLEFKPSSVFSPARLQQGMERLLALYHNNGYYFASVSVDSLVYSSDSSGVDIFMRVKEESRALIRSIGIEGNTVFTTEQIFREFDSRPGAVFLPSRLERDIDNLLASYEQSGYPLTKVSISDIRSRIDSSSSDLEIDLRVEEGELVRINEISVEGNTETKADVVVRETRLREGEPYNAEKIRTIPRKLNRLNIFSSVNEPELYMTSRGGGVLIRVEEGPANAFDGVLGYVPSSGGETGYFTGVVDVGMRNLFGTARKLNVRWQREDRFSQELFLKYVEPWVLGEPVNLGGSFFQRQQDTTYVRRTIELRTDLLVTENLSLGALYNHEVIVPSSSLVGQAVFNSSTITTGLEVRYDLRDDIVSPTSGILYRSDYRIGRKKIFGLPDTTSAKTRLTVQRFGMDVEWYLQTFERQVLALALHGREIRSDQIELSDLYRFGGATTMRGYRESQFVGSRVVWSNVEYRFSLARRSYVFGFFDTGYYYRPGDDAKGTASAQAVKYGYGIGLRVETALGNIGVSFALGEGDSFNQGKIHFGLMNEF